MSESSLIAELLRHCDYHQLPHVPSAHPSFPRTETGRRRALEAAGHLPKALNRTQVPGVDSSRMLRA